MTLSKCKERIKERRESLNMTQLQLSQKTGISINTVKGYERKAGGISLSLGTLEILCNALQCDAAYLLGEIDVPRREVAEICESVGLNPDVANHFEQEFNSPGLLEEGKHSYAPIKFINFVYSKGSFDNADALFLALNDYLLSIYPKTMFCDGSTFIPSITIENSNLMEIETMLRSFRQKFKQSLDSK
ncbi:MAG: helix-turn-helix domain-containing protein [Faecalibacterium sp.]|jgi:transcriptional regulator with XRE-family HTH domain|nr:helix-turn-helix domain-containing protein [Faecalibacterium sp.]